MKIKLGVIFGGQSVEHEVSIISAVQAMKSLDKDKYEIIPIYVTKDLEWYTGEILKQMDTYTEMDLLKRYTTNVVLYNKKGHFYLQSKGFFKRIKQEIDIMFPIVHGTNMEDGVLQGYLQTIGVPYVGSDTYASSVGQDKVLQKLVYESKNLPVAPYTWFYDVDYNENADSIIKECSKLKYPVIVKPATLGSSVGIEVAKNEVELRNAIEEACKYDKKILVEHVVPNLTEANISVLGNYKFQEVSLIEEVNTSHALLTYEDKYIGGGKSSKTPSKGMASLGRIIPAPLGDKLTKEIENIAITAFKAIGNSGVARIDFLIDKEEKKAYINEINTCPGSLSFYLWEPKGKKYRELLDEMIKIGIKDYQVRTKKVHSFDSNILAGYNGTKGAKGSKFGGSKF